LNGWSLIRCLDWAGCEFEIPSGFPVYFISKSDGRIEEGMTLNWEFPEFEGSWSVKILKVEENKHIAFSWEVVSGHITMAEMNLVTSVGHPKTDI